MPLNTYHRLAPAPGERHRLRRVVGDPDIEAAAKVAA